MFGFVTMIAGYLFLYRLFIIYLPPALKILLQASRNEGSFQKIPVDLHDFSDSGNHLVLRLCIGSQSDCPYICIYQGESGSGRRFHRFQ